MIETTANGHNSAKAMLPPHNLEAEKSVLGAVLLDERHLNRLVFDEQLRADHFFREQYGRVFEAMLKLHQNDRKIDHLTVAEVLRERGQLEAIGGPEAIDELAGWVPAAGHAREYGRIVRENAHMRELLRATYEIQAQVAERRHRGEEMIEEAERLIFALRGKELQANHRLLEHAVAEEIDRVESAAHDDREIPGLATGIRELDRLLAGLQDGRLYVVAARPAMGKSLLCLQIARHVAFKERQRVLFASLERAIRRPPNVTSPPRAASIPNASTSGRSKTMTGRRCWTLRAARWTCPSTCSTTATCRCSRSGRMLARWRSASNVSA